MSKVPVIKRWYHWTKSVLCASSSITCEKTICVISKAKTGRSEWNIFRMFIKLNLFQSKLLTTANGFWPLPSKQSPKPVKPAMQRENRRIGVYDLTKFPLWDVYMLTLKEGKNDNDLWTNVNPKLLTWGSWWGLKSTDALVNYKWVCGAFAAYSCITFDPDYAMIQHITQYLSFHCINALTFGGRNQK